MRSVLLWCLLVVGAVLLFACSDDSGPTTVKNPEPPAPGDVGVEIDNGFESDDPDVRRQGSSGTSGSATGGSSGTSGAPQAPGGDAARTIEEADIIKVAGTHLYALSRYGGLSVVDVSNPSQMTVAGRKRTSGLPFEMYVQNSKAFVMLNETGRWVGPTNGSAGQFVETSEIVALDVTNPSAIRQDAVYEVPGRIADSRLVGDVLYVVSHENGYCWGCVASNPGTVVTSFRVGAGPITKVDQLAYRSATSGAWQRSVSATNQRLYIAGPEWSWTPTDTNGRSVIQVVDISDPSGRLVKGADVTIAGQISSRWQMDEEGGVLRVISQHNRGWGNGQINPTVETFTIQSSSSFVPLGKTDIVLPQPESLQSVRFDGARAYAITFRRIDPLFTVDLGDPAHPRQAGELEMPGWIFHMEPRGDRLIGFGYDDVNNTSLAVSLFDVSDIGHPSMLSRVNFGQGWGTFAEDQDRIHKSVRVLDEQGLVLIPFASYPRWTGSTCAAPESGIQLVDFSRDGLVKRGIAPQQGQPRRAIALPNQGLLAVSDRNVTSFDITSRDTPVKKHEVDLSNPSYRMIETPNGLIAAISNHWWTGEALLSLTPSANPDDANAVGKVPLVDLVPTADRGSYCGAGSWASWYDARLFVQDQYVFVTVPVTAYGSDSGPYGPRVRTTVVVASVDVSVPAAPKIVGRLEVPLSQQQAYDGWACGMNYDGYRYYSSIGGPTGGLVVAGEGTVQVGRKLAYLENVYTAAGDVDRKLHVIDLSNPASPFEHPPVMLGATIGQSTPLQVANGIVLTSRWVRSTKNPGKVRFFVDRVDLNGASPLPLPSINTPGSLVSVDLPTGRFVTADYLASRRPTTDWNDCYFGSEGRGYLDRLLDECVVVHRNLKLSDVQNGKVTLRQTFELPSQHISQVLATDDRLYITHYARYDYTPRQQVCGPTGCISDPPRLLEQGGLWAIGGLRGGKLAIVSELNEEAQWPLAARGTKVAVGLASGLAVYDTSTPAPRLLADDKLRGWGYSSHVSLAEGYALASLGDFGLQTIRF